MFTHYHQTIKTVPKKKWNLITERVKKLFQNATCKLVSEYDCDEPPIISDRVIIFNGFGEEGHETCIIRKRCSASDWTKTARKPYDDYVRGCFSICKEIAPECFELSSDDGPDIYDKKDFSNTEISDTEIVDYLSKYWNSQSNFGIILDQVFPNVTGSFRDAVKHKMDNNSINSENKIKLPESFLIKGIVSIIVRVLTYKHTGRIEDADYELVPHLEQIKIRYKELTREHDFVTSAYMARIEWLSKFLSESLNS